MDEIPFPAFQRSSQQKISTPLLSVLCTSLSSPYAHTLCQGDDFLPGSLKTAILHFLPSPLPQSVVLVSSFLPGNNLHLNPLLSLLLPAFPKPRI